MATIITHRNTRIITLEPEDDIHTVCRAGDIALVEETDGWWTKFVGENGEVDSYDEAFESYNKALWTAKAVAEYESAGD